MFDRLLDFLLNSLRAFQFWEVVDEYERAIVLRFGRYHRTLEPGIHWMWPFYIERSMSDNVVPRTANLGDQTLTTADGRTVTVAAVVTARINDIRKSLLEVEHVDDALRDSCLGEVGRVVSETTWDDLWHGKANDLLTAACRRGGWRYGLEIMRVQLTDAAPCKSLRLWTQ